MVRLVSSKLHVKFSHDYKIKLRLTNFRLNTAHKVKCLCLSQTKRIIKVVNEIGH